MITAHMLWESILECDSPSDLSDECWERLYLIARNMNDGKFSTGSERDVSKKLINALGYKNFDDFREPFRLKDKIKFLYDVSHVWDENKLNLEKVFAKEVHFAGYPLKGQSLKNKLKKVLDSLNIGRLNNPDSSSRTLQSLMLYFCDDALEGETPMDTYKRWDAGHP